MTMNELMSKDLLFLRIKAPVAAGTSNQTSSTFDLAGYDGVVYVVSFGTLTAGQVTSLQAQSGAASDGSDAADITGAATAAMADADSNKLLVLDVARDSKRYGTLVIKRATQNAVIDVAFAILYRARALPVAQLATHVSQIKQFLSA